MGEGNDSYKKNCYQKPRETNKSINITRNIILRPK